MEFALGILAGILVAAVADILIGFWMAAHRGRMAARVIAGELAGHDLGLCRALGVDDLRDIPATDSRRGGPLREATTITVTGGPTRLTVAKPPYLGTSAWAEMRSAIMESAPVGLLVPLVGWYQPLQDEDLVARSQLGGVIDAFLEAAAAIEHLESRSRWAGFWYVLRGAPSGS